MAETMEEIEEHYGEYAELVRAMVLVEIRYPDEEDAQKIHTTINWNDTMNSPTDRAGLLVLALTGVLK
jgi:hypothetical protein